MSRSLARFLVGAVVAVVVSGASSLTGAAAKGTYGRGGPRDWSYGRLIATRFGPDRDRNVERDWRTHARHARLDQARALAIRPILNNGALGSATGYAQLHRSGAAAVVDASPVTEFLTASSLANKDFVFVGGGGTYLFMNRIGAGFGGSNASPTNMDSWFAVTGGVVSGIVVDTRTANITGSTATANIYFGTKGVGSSTQSTIVQLAQQF
jgi:hypothetical protein